MRLHIFQHVPFEGPGIIADWAKKHGWSVSTTRFYEKSARIPSRNEYDMLVIMGGPMSVHDDEIYPWLSAEKKAITKAIIAGKQVLGICLGAQLIAYVLGAGVMDNAAREIGFHQLHWAIEGRSHPVLHDIPEGIEAFHWHGETFSIPGGAIRLAGSEACGNQIFIYDSRVLAVQCHLEMTEQGVRDMIANCGHELVDGPWIQQEAKILAQLPKLAENHRAMEQLLDNWTVVCPVRKPVTSLAA